MAESKTELSVAVKTFFQNAKAFKKIAGDVAPSWFKRDGDEEPIRVWVSGCGNGAEAYSFAILLLEEAERHKIGRPPIQVFASDRDPRAVVAAREGRFPLDIAADVSQERLQRFFLREGNQYRVRQEVREVVLFAVHDLLKDPPFSHVNMISCRNVPLQPDRELQKQVCSIFHYALNPGGFLFAGNSVAAENPAGLFRVVDSDARIYQSTAVTGGRPRHLPRALAGGVQEQVPGLRLTTGPTLSEAAMHRRAIEQVAPPSMLVDKSYRIVHLSENAGRYLLPSGGPLSSGAFNLVRPELRIELRSALDRAFAQNVPTLTLPILVRFDDFVRRTHMLIQPARNDNLEPHSAVVMFIEGEAVDESLVAGQGEITDLTVRRLTQELEMTEDRLRGVREESALANEKLRATNEELQSMNEEYRSAFNELETGKELQWVNEELQNVNIELKSKVEAISRAHSDLQNLVAAADFGALFLDSDLRIKRFTDRARELFSIPPDNEGRPIADFTHQLAYDNLVRDALAVLTNLTPIRREVRSRQGRWYDMRVRPYRTTDGKIDGVVVTFIDVTERHDIDNALKASERHLRQVQTLVELSRDPIFIWDFDDGILAWNRGSEELYGYSRKEAIGRRKDQLLATEVPGSSFAELRARLLADGSFNGEVRHRTKDGRELTIETLIVLETMDGKRLALESTRDITERRQWEKRQQLLVGELAHRVRNTLAVVQAIAHQSLRTSRSSEDFVQGFDGRLSALASAHSLLVRTDWQGADLATLVESQLEAYADRLRMEGEPVLLPPNLATPFGLILHELATNAAKHGSLSRRGGAVDLTWNVDTGNNARILSVEWREHGGPPVKEPTTRGLGSALIQNGIPSATVKREFNPAGLVCSIELPLPNPGEIGTVETA
jgi:two-component system, chemotaxis family, CheB/CheR fusion protein